MANGQPAEDEHQRFTAWAIDQGVQINRVAPKRFENRGVGIVATDRIQAGDVLTVVPPSALVSAYSVPGEVKSAIGPVTTHGLLAAVLCLDAKKSHSPWRAWRSVWPSRQSFASMPLLWDEILQALLPFAAVELLAKQKQNLARDFAAVTKAFPDISEDNFRYHWLLVNTRSFYYVKPGVKRKPPQDDRMALCPFDDYFNHADSGVCVQFSEDPHCSLPLTMFKCPVSFGPLGFSITSDRSYDTGDEIYLSYGNHSNDFLLAEYGFLLGDNKWDEMRLDDVILPLLSVKQKNFLSDAGFLGKYILDQNTICYRTEVALKVTMLPEKLWPRYADEDQGPTERKMSEKIVEVVKVLEDRATKRVKTLERNEGHPEGSEILQSRWRQILRLLESARSRYGTET